MKRRRFLGTAGLLVTAGATGRTVVGRLRQTGTDGYRTIRVPQDAATVQEGIDAAEQGDLVLVDPGTYTESVAIETPRVTLRGRNRNEVVLDGEFTRTNGIDITGDGVAVENLTVRGFETNAVYWHGIEGFRGSFLTAYNNGLYGIYAYDSRDGRFEFSYASGHPDAGFYLGRTQPFDAVISDVVAEHNAMGYSGTSTGENLTIRDSVWRHNKAGIVPNTLDTADPPQRASTIVGNVVYDNTNPDAPSVDHTYPTFGMGIALWGGSDNVVEDNVVDGHGNFGIVAEHNVAEPSGNVVRGNTIADSGEADLALGSPAGGDNAFEANQFATSLPAGLTEDASRGSQRVSEVFTAQERQTEGGDPPGGDYRDQPEPGPRPTMQDPEAPPRPASRSATWSEQT